MMSYDRQRSSMTQPSQQQQQQQHPSAMMSQNIPSSTASNLSPTPNLLSMQGGLQSQSQIDSMRSMSQQPAPVPGWNNNYYGQTNQSPYPSVMNPYMNPYGTAATIPNHASASGQPTARPALGQKPSTIGNDRARAAPGVTPAAAPYTTPNSSLYGQPPQSSSTGSYYGYDSYYNQVANQAATDQYLSHSSGVSGSQHWPSSAASNSQMIGSSPSAPGPLQPPLRPQTGSGSSAIHPQSPSAPSALPTLSSRPPPPSHTPDRSPAPQQHPTSYTNPSATLQQPPAAFHGPKDVQPSSSDHMMSYDRQRGSMAQQQQHPSAMMSQNIPSSTASNLSPTQSQMSMQNRLQSQSQIDPMRSISQQPSSVPGWNNNYYGQTNQSPYSSVMNSYMSPYGTAATIPSHGPLANQPTTKPSPSQKPSTIGNDRARAAPGGSPAAAPYTAPNSSLYGQPPPPAPSGSYYGYDSYYNQVANQAATDQYLSHSSGVSGSQHWPSSAASNSQMIGSSPSAPGPLQPPLRPQTGSGSSAIHPQSPSAPSALPTLSSRPPPPSQTPERSPAHSSQYPNANQGSTSKSTSNSLAQLEQMVMPSGNQSTPSTKSPTHRSSTSSPTAASAQQSLQYSYNSSGQGSYFSTGAGATSNQSNYYPQYESSAPEMSKPGGWSEQSMMNPMSNAHGTTMLEGSQSSYGQTGGYEGSGSYGDYTSLSTTSNSCTQPRFPTTGDTTESLSSDKGDPYAIDSQTFDDYDDTSAISRTKKGRSRKGEEKVKKERKPRAPRASKAGNSSTQPQSPSTTVSLQTLPTKPPQPPAQAQPIPPPSTASQQPEMSPVPQIPGAGFPSPNQQDPSGMGSTSSEPQTNPILSQSSASTMSATSKSPAHRLSTESPNTVPQQQLQYSYNSSNQPPSYYSPTPPAVPSNQPNYYPPYESSTSEQKSWGDQPPSSIVPQSSSAGISSADASHSTYDRTNYDSSTPYSEYTPLTVVPNAGSTSSNNSQPQQQSQFPPTDKPEVSQVETNDTPAFDSHVSDDGFDQPTGSKTKKSRAKKTGDEKVKKERKPRAAKGSKSSNSGTQPSSPISTTPIQASTPQVSESNSTPPPPVSNQYSSPTQNPSTKQDSSGFDDSSAVSTLALASQSPSHRLSTESPNLTQYSHSNSRQPGYSNTTTQSNQSNYYPQYESNGSDLPKPTRLSEQSSTPLSSNTGEPALEGSSLTDSGGFEGSSSYPDFSKHTSTNNNSQCAGPDESIETSSMMEVEEQKSADLQVAEHDIQAVKPSGSKSRPKKSRAKKSGEEKSKKERKTRSAKAPTQPPPELPSLTPPPPPLEDNTELATSQSTQESVSTVEPKPKRIRIRDSSSKGKKKLPKFALKFAKTKKRKRLGSSDNDQSDLDKTPPPSPDEVESGVQKRRSARNTKKLKYNDDIELGFSDSDDDTQVLPRTKKVAVAVPGADGDSTAVEDTVIVDEPTVFTAPVEDTMVVEKIMATRIGQRELEPEPGEVLPPDGTHIEVEEFYVKYKNLSYLHCDWRTLEELEKGDRRVVQKVKRYKQKKDSSNLFNFMDEEPFDPLYCEVDRILAVNEVEEMVPETDDEDKKEKPKDETILNPDSSPAPINIVPNPPVDDKPQDDVKTEAGPDNKEPIPTDSVEQVEKPIEENKTIEEITEEKSNTEEEKEKDKGTETEAETETVIEKKEGEEEKLGKDEVEHESVDTKSTITKTDEPIEKLNETVEKEAEKVIEKPIKMKKKISRHYLVKWRGLSYEESTWELEDDLDQDKIKHFERFKNPPPKSKWRMVRRPKPEDWSGKKKSSPVYKNNNTLREYQLEGINWLSYCWHQGRNCILADEMGLGKTIQSIAFINEIYQHGINGPFLIIVPLSTVGNWAREFETWTDLNVITYHGSSTSREMLKEYEMFYRNEQGNRITSYYKFQVMITTFEIILSDCLDLREIPWRCCIIDEAHRLKNRNCKLLEGLRLLNMEHRVLLTGTPLQNNVEELFSLLNFLEPTKFCSNEQFMLEFGDLKTEAQVDKLKESLKPMMLRRLKEDVEKTLAPKEETIVEVELTNIQKKYYRAILEKNFSFLTKGSSNNNMPNLMNTMMELRKCCIHPYLINGAEEQIEYETRQAKLAGAEPMSSFQALVNSSGKLVLIDKLLPRLKADGHRVLIFSQMVRCLDILEDYVTHKHYPFERIDGRVRGSDRQQAIDRFSKPGSDRFVFLLCTRAGGLGINLTAADTVIIFDSDWNPQNDLQAQARCHRIGQSKAVKIYRLICRNTYEREMFDKASLKLGLDKAVLQSMNTQKGGAGGCDGQMSKKEIEELLRKGAYGALMDDDNAGDKFCEEDIDQILQRRTQVITIDNSEAKGSTFSKATFSSSNNREDIELDDPNFWEKWAKKANIDSDELLTKDELIQLAPRRRTQTKRYGADGNLLDISDLESSDEDEETISMRTRGSRGRQPKLTPSSSFKRSKRNRPFEFKDDEFIGNRDGGYWSKSDCLKVEKGLLTYGWGRWEKIISSNRYKRDLSVEDCESICRVILLYCLNNYKGDEKIKSFAWEIITPSDDGDRAQSDSDNGSSRRKSKLPPILSKKTVADEIADANWPKEAKNDPLIALPDDQYRRHLQRNSNRLLIRVKFLHYLKNDILKGYTERILSDCATHEVDIPPVPVDGDLPASWWDDEADKCLLVGIFKHGYDKFNLMRQDPTLCFLQKCGPPNKDDLLAEMSYASKNVEDLDDENRDLKESLNISKDSITMKDEDAGEFLENLVTDVVAHVYQDGEKNPNDEAVDENKNSILKFSESHSNNDSTFDNGVNEINQTVKMDTTDDESLTNETLMDSTPAAPDSHATAQNMETGDFMPFPIVTDLNQRFRRLITAYQRNSKRLEIKLAQKARDELKKERTSKFEAAKNEREERKRFLAQKWSRREEADFFRAISSFGVEYDPIKKKHDWNKFRSIGKLDKKLDETLEEYYKAFIIMCKRVTSRPLTADEEKCPINVDTITEERASRCLARIEFLNKIREQIITHPELDERLKLCAPQSELPDWWENGKHDKDLLIAAAKHGLTRLDYNLAHDNTLSLDDVIKQKSEQIFNLPPSSILIPIEQLQELLESNGIEYLKDLDLQDDSEDVKIVLDSILDNLNLEEVNATESGYKSFADLVDGPHSKTTDDSLSKTFGLTRLQPKTTRSSMGLTNLTCRPLPNILARRGANTVVRSAETTSGPNPHSVRLASSGHHTRADERRVVEITPIMPDKIPAEPVKSFEAGELTVTIQSESALLQLDDRAPIILFGATNPISAKIRWPKDKAIQTRLENLVYLVEKNEWPTPPKPLIPTITLPNHMTTVVPTSTPLVITTSSPTKVEKTEVPIGSPKSDISNISSLTSKQDSKELSIDTPASSKSRRGRGRKPKQSESVENIQQEVEAPKEDRQAAAKLRNLLSQGPSSARNLNQPTLATGEKLTTKFGGNKQGGLSSLLASFKQKRSEGTATSTRSREQDKNILDLNSSSSSNLLPQILANMKPEFRDLLANQDAATMLLNSLSGMTGVANLQTTNLRSSNSNTQVSIENLLNVSAKNTSKNAPPPAHQRSDNPPSAHGNSSSTRELRRGSQSNREEAAPSINLRSTRGKTTLTTPDNLSSHKSVEHSHGKSTSSGKKRGRPSSSASESPPPPPPPPTLGSDVLDLSSLPLSVKSSSTSRTESRSRRHRDQSDESALNSFKSQAGSSKSNVKNVSKHQDVPIREPSPEKGTRTTRASKRIGSRIDALALNLQAKRLNRGDSPSADLSPSLPKDKNQESPVAAHGSAKTTTDTKSHSSKAPPAAHSGPHKSSSSNELRTEKTALNQSIPTTNIPTQPVSTPSRQSQDPMAQFMSNPSSLLTGLNPGALSGAGDLMNQLLRKAGTNDIVKNLLNEFMKNPSLALDPNILATLTASLPMSSQSLPGFNLPTPTTNTLPSTSSTKTTPSSLLTDFKSPSSNSLMKRSRQDTSTSSRHSVGNSTSSSTSHDSRRSSSSLSERHERRSMLSVDKRSSSYQERSDKHGKHEKRGSSSNNHQQQQQSLRQESSADSSRRSSSSLLAHQTPPPLPQTSQIPTSSSTPLNHSTMPNAATLNLANQFGGLNSFGNLLGLPAMNELMKQMSNFPNLAATLPRVSNAPLVSNPTSISNPSIQSNGDKGSRRSRQSMASTSTTQTASVTNQQQANAALANSIMNLASQPNPASNPYGSYTNPLANPFLPFGLANFGMNNPLAGMGLFPNLYMPQGFPAPDQQQQQQQQPNQSGGTSDGSSRDKKMRYPKK